MSTGYNRTTMSAYAHMLGMFPNGVGPTLTTGQQAAAVPPSKTANLYLSPPPKAFNTSSTFAVVNQAQPFPVHNALGNPDFLLRAYRKGTCPYMGELEKIGYAKANTNVSELQPFFNEFRNTNKNITEELDNLKDIEPFVDGWWAAHFNATLKQEAHIYALTNQTISLIDVYFGKIQNEVVFFNSTAVQIACTNFFTLLTDVINAKVDISQGNTEIDHTEFEKNIKFMMFAGHDGTVAAFMHGVGHP
jgi:hypothetical protein